MSLLWFYDDFFLWQEAYMVPMVSAQSTAGFSLFDSVPEDYFHFGVGNSFQPKVVPEVLGLKREDVSKLASVSLKSVRYDDSIPEPMRERLEEIAITINMVAKFFDGDTDKTVTWFRARNPMLGDVSPRDMIRLGRFERLRKFIINAVLDKNRTHVQEPEMA
ncbi:MAG: hypothetical protein KA316_06925 [Rhodoferax sp.]|nr:hypothetical protein [Rhodoferax sp.]